MSKKFEESDAYSRYSTMLAGAILNKYTSEKNKDEITKELKKSTSRITLAIKEANGKQKPSDARDDREEFSNDFED